MADSFGSTVLVQPLLFAAGYAVGGLINAFAPPLDPDQNLGVTSVETALQLGVTGGAAQIVGTQLVPMVVARDTLGGLAMQIGLWSSQSKLFVKARHVKDESVRAVLNRPAADIGPSAP